MPIGLRLDLQLHSQIVHHCKVNICLLVYDWTCSYILTLYIIVKLTYAYWFTIGPAVTFSHCTSL